MWLCEISPNTISTVNITNKNTGTTSTVNCSNVSYFEMGFYGFKTSAYSQGTPVIISTDGYNPVEIEVLTSEEETQKVSFSPILTISKLSNGTDTYVLKDETARTSISTIQNNLVTSVSSASTDSQYPSAKCVYDLFGTIESQLAEVNSKITMATFTVTINRFSQYIDSFIIEGVDYKSSFIDNTSNSTCSANIQLPKGSSYDWTLNWNTYASASSSDGGYSINETLTRTIDLTSGNGSVAISLTMTI